MAITYHDPCHLGRMSDTRIPSHGVEHYELGTMPIKDIPKVMGMNGVYDPPREVLKSIPGIKLIEMERRREYAWCCGSGGGVKSAYPELAMDTVKERLEEAQATGAETIVSCCPWCEKNFEDGIRASGSELKVVDAVDLLIQSVE
ncbi:MAG: heterodisulfide reductase-related iron-sulfur binding cluster [Proteobacteria bacterium]|nr:heterodisulfide reductase-related iron-sulfur binding cluster [Pseudomonadota bacterium]